MAIYDMGSAIRQPDAGNFEQGLLVGQQFAQNRRQNQARSALARLAQGDQSALPELMQADPDAGMKWQDMQRAEETRTGLQGFFKPAQADLVMPSGNPVNNALSMLAGGPSMAPQIKQTQPASFDAMGATNFLASRGDTNALKTLMEMQNPSSNDNAFGTVLYRNGEAFQLTKTPGKLISLGSGFDAPTRVIDTGSQIVVAPTRGSHEPVAVLPKDVDPSSVYSNNKQDQRLERSAELDVQTAAEKKRIEAQVGREQEVAEQVRGADAAIADLTTLENALVDLPSPAALRLESAKAFVGRADPKIQQAIGTAKVISGRMLKYVERLPGAATDKDREVFMASAGVLSNDDLPVDQRIAAARAAKEAYQRLLNKYGNQQNPGGQPGTTKPAGTSKAAAWLKSRNIRTQDDARKAVQELTRKGWSRAQIEQALDEAGL